MPLTNKQISEDVATIVGAIRKEAIRPEDQKLIDAAAAIATNLLQNINDLAAKARGDIE